jgi:hypothetical protein
MAPQPTVKKPDFMKIRFWDHCGIWIQVAGTVFAYLLLMISIGIVYKTSGIYIDPSKYGLDIARGKIKCQ